MLEIDDSAKNEIATVSNTIEKNSKKDNFDLSPLIMDVESEKAHNSSQSQSMQIEEIPAKDLEEICEEDEASE